MLCNYNIYPDVRPSDRCCQKIADLFIQMAYNEGRSKSIKFDIPTEYTKLMMAFHIACKNKKKSTRDCFISVELADNKLLALICWLFYGQGKGHYVEDHSSFPVITQR